MTFGYRRCFMHWISIFLIALASNLDNLGIGISYGMRLTKIPAFSNMITTLITMLGTFISMTIGEYISRYIIDSVANMLGASVIIAIGIWTLAGTIRKYDLEHAADINHKKVISIKESFTLGVALALNNLATGIGAGATGLSPLWTTLTVGLFSLLFIGTGSRIGQVVARTWFGRYSIVLSGIILISIGIYEMIA
jgi:putative Mn2+ efflux pump MntP